MTQEQAENIVREAAKQIKMLRQAKLLSHNALAKKAGITRVAISHIESGRRNPSLKVALRLAHALDTTLSDLIRPLENRS